jgi:hypothetical protein
MCHRLLTVYVVQPPHVLRHGCVVVGVEPVPAGHAAIVVLQHLQQDALRQVAEANTRGERRTVLVLRRLASLKVLLLEWG